jgi:hypothetical protein
VGARGRTALAFDPRARPLRELLAGVHARYGRPILLAETSIEGERRADWLRHVGAEVREAIRRGVPVEGVCLYPVLSHPGWDDDRYCPNGLLEMEARDGRRMEHAPLAAELRRQQQLLTAMLGIQAGKNRAEEADGPQPGSPRSLGCLTRHATMLPCARPVPRFTPPEPSRGEIGSKPREGGTRE